MNKMLRLGSLIMIMFLCVGLHTADAQYYGKKKKKKKKKAKTEKTDDYFDESGGFAHRLWYGADFSLNFYPVNVDGYNGNVFVFGLSPMVGYKITDFLSVGPRVEFFNQSMKLQYTPTDDLKYNSLDIGLGVFTRVAFLERFFIHGEIQTLSAQRPSGEQIDPIELKIPTERNWEGHQYLGVGYYSGSGLIGFNAYALWDFAQEFSSTNIPISYRIGLTYNFQ